MTLVQVADYGASAFYHFAKRGHRFKCWECGVKKKAPCGATDRPDLPWCCHRRLGAFMPLLSVQRNPAGAITLTSAPAASCILSIHGSPVLCLFWLLLLHFCCTTG